MDMFIEVTTTHAHNYREVESALINAFGYNEAYWRVDGRGTVRVYYKDFHVIQHLI